MLNLIAYCDDPTNFTHVSSVVHMHKLLHVVASSDSSLPVEKIINFQNSCLKLTFCSPFYRPRDSVGAHVGPAVLYGNHMNGGSEVCV